MAVRKKSQIFQPSFSLAILKFRQMKNFPWECQHKIFFFCRVLDYYSPCSLGFIYIWEKRSKKGGEKGKGLKRGGMQMEGKIKKNEMRKGESWISGKKEA